MKKYLFAIYICCFLFAWSAAVQAAGMKIIDFHKDPKVSGNQTVSLRIKPTSNGEPCDGPPIYSESYTYSTHLSEKNNNALPEIPATCTVLNFPRKVNDLAVWTTDPLNNNVIEKTKLAPVIELPGNKFSLVPFTDAFAALAAGEPVYTPMAYSSSVTLYLGIDLVAWSSQPIPAWNEQDVVNVVNGEVFDQNNVKFPGLIIGTSDILFSEDLGLYTTDPFTGSALIDGTAVLAVYEPATIYLLLNGLVLCLLVFSKENIRRSA